ncbi:MAG: S-layer homology domain-containing protein [Thermoleophilia bacterium]|nr:S-layer homology domain-containing protein [Thermoleophilia bacterium]
MCDGIRMRLRFGSVLLAAALVIVLASASPVVASSGQAAGLRAQSSFSVSALDSWAIRVDGSLWMWGDYEEGDEGLPDLGYLKPTRAGIDADWASVSSGMFTTLALKADGTLWEPYFGYENEIDFHQGKATFYCDRVGTDRDWTAASAGGLFGDSLALKSNGSLWLLRYDFEAELDNEIEMLIPSRLGTESDWTAVAAGPWAESLALKRDGSLWVVTVEPQFVEHEDLPLLYLINRVGTDCDWAAISVGGEHMLALKTDGSLWAWGGNSAGQLGDGTTTNRDEPIRIGTETDWVAVSAGHSYSLALKGDGTLWSWGYNSDAQLGDGTREDKHVPGRVGISNKWRAVTAGYAHSMAVQADGTLWAWGDGSVGQLGDGTTERRRVPTRVLDEVRVPDWPEEIEADFSDVAGSPYEAAIDDLTGRGIIAGFDDGTFRAEAAVSRQQFAKMIVKALAITVTGSEVCPFADVVAETASDPLYPAKYIAVCAQRGITQGKTATTFEPYKTITREQLITMIARAAALADPPADYVPDFESGQFSLEQHYSNARKAAYGGLLEGLQGLGPSYGFRGPATRGECAQVLHNLLVMLES